MTGAQRPAWPGAWPESELQTRWLWLVCAAAALLGCTYSAYFGSVGLTSGTAAGPLCLAIGAASIGLARLTGRAALGLDLACALLFVALAALTMLHDGVRSPALWWLAVPPVVALLAGRGWLGAALCAAFALQASMLHSHGSGSWLAVSMLSDDPAAQLTLAMTLSALSVAVFVALGSHWQRQSWRTLEQGRRAALADAAAAARFVSVMSHEIRTPLQTVVGATELLRQPGLAAERHEQAAAAQRQGADMLMALVGDVLDLARLTAGKVVLDGVPVRLAALLEHMRDLFAAQAGAKGLVLTVSVSPDVPPVVLGDGQRIRQVLVNLIANAIKFTGSGGVQVHVGLDGAPAQTARSADHRTHVRFAVADSGVGIEPAALASLFQPFQQADPSIARRFGGSGLGLSIADELARLMGGRIELTSALGRGSTFALVIPLAAAPAEEIESVPNASQANAPTLPAGLAVLVADDDGANRTVAAAMLEFLSLRPVVAEDGAQALALLASRRFDAVLMDMRMPELDGLEATRRWRAHEAEAGQRRTPIIAITGNAECGDALACAAAGIDEMLVKPFGLEDLRRVLTKVLATSQAARDQPSGRP